MSNRRQNSDKTPVPFAPKRDKLNRTTRKFSSGKNTPDETANATMQVRPLGQGVPSAFPGDATPLPSNLEEILGDDTEEGEACLIVIYGPEMGKSTPLSEDVLTIGRSRSNDLHLASDRLSRFHCKIERAGDTFILKDLDSTNGTFVNNDRVVQRRLEDGDHVQVGRVILKFMTGTNVERLLHKAVKDLQAVDGLTGKGNRIHLFKSLHRELQTCVVGARSTALALFKINDYPAYDATYGDGASDVVVRNICPVFERRLRSQDVLCRYAEDMFGVVMPGLTLHAAKHRATLVAKLVEQTPIPIPSQAGESLAPVQINWGVAATDDPNTSDEELFSYADEQLNLLGTMRDKEDTGIHHIVSLRPRHGQVDSEQSEPAPPDGDLTGVFVVPPELQRTKKAIPIEWLSARVSEYATLTQYSGRLGLIVCALQDQLGALARSSTATLQETEQEIVWAISGWNRDVFRIRDGVFLCFADVESRTALADIARSIEEAYRSKGGNELAQPLELCFGFAIAESFDISVEPLQRAAMTDLIERSALAVQNDVESLLPHPVAWSLEQVRACVTPDSELRATFLACERILRFGAMVMLGSLLTDWERWASTQRNFTWFQEQITHQRWSTGDWWQLTLGLAKLLVRVDHNVTNTVARCFVKTNGKPTDGMKAASKIVELRNRWAHGRGFIGTEGELRRSCPEASAELDVFVKGLAPLRDLELATVVRLRALRTGGFESTMRSHTGPDQLFIAEERRLSQALTESTYLFDRNTEDFVCLWPFIIFESCPLCSQEELFWTIELQLDDRVQYEGIITSHELTLELQRQDFDELPEIFKR